MNALNTIQPTLLRVCLAVLPALFGLPTPAQDAGQPPGASGVDSCLVFSETRIAEALSGFVGPTEAESQLGSGVAALGDLDGDGNNDLACTIYSPFDMATLLSQG